MAIKKKTKKKYLYRSAITGKTVTAKYAKANPDTTVKETITKKK